MLFRLPLVLFAIPALLAQTTLTLAEAEQTALRNNPQVSVATFNALAAEQAAREANSNWYPTVTGQATDLTHVSPKTGRAVSREPAKPYCDRLLRLPQFLISDAAAAPGDIADAFRLTGHFLHMHVWDPRQVDPPSIRDALIADLTDRV